MLLWYSPSITTCGRATVGRRSAPTVLATRTECEHLNTFINTCTTTQTHVNPAQIAASQLGTKLVWIAKNCGHWDPGHEPGSRTANTHQEPRTLGGSPVMSKNIPVLIARNPESEPVKCAKTVRFHSILGLKAYPVQTLPKTS